jgi:long-subunit fatty acid transport protein
MATFTEESNLSENAKIILIYDDISMKLVGINISNNHKTKILFYIKQIDREIYFTEGKNITVNLPTNQQVQYFTKVNPKNAAKIQIDGIDWSARLGL